MKSFLRSLGSSLTSLVAFLTIQFIPLFILLFMIDLTIKNKNFQAWYKPLIKSYRIDQIWYTKLSNIFSLYPSEWFYPFLFLFSYIFISIAALMIWRKNGFLTKTLYWYYAQLIFKILYLFILSETQNLFLISILSFILFITLIKTMLIFFEESFEAGLLFVPYVTWTGFVLCLDISTFVLQFYS